MATQHPTHPVIQWLVTCPYYDPDTFSEIPPSQIARHPGLDQDQSDELSRYIAAQNDGTLEERKKLVAGYFKNIEQSFGEREFRRSEYESAVGQAHTMFKLFVILVVVDKTVESWSQIAPLFWSQGLQLVHQWLCICAKRGNFFPYIRPQDESTPLLSRTNQIQTLQLAKVTAALFLNYIAQRMDGAEDEESYINFHLPGNVWQNHLPELLSAPLSFYQSLNPKNPTQFVTGQGILPQYQILPYGASIYALAGRTEADRGRLHLRCYPIPHICPPRFIEVLLLREAIPILVNNSQVPNSINPIYERRLNQELKKFFADQSKLESPVNINNFPCTGARTDPQVYERVTLRSQHPVLRPLITKMFYSLKKHGFEDGYQDDVVACSTQFVLHTFDGSFGHISHSIHPSSNTVSASSTDIEATPATDYTSTTTDNVSNTNQSSTNEVLSPEPLSNPFIELYSTCQSGRASRKWRTTNTIEEVFISNINTEVLPRVARELTRTISDLHIPETAKHSDADRIRYWLKAGNFFDPFPAGDTSISDASSRVHNPHIFLDTTKLHAMEMNPVPEIMLCVDRYKTSFEYSYGVSYNLAWFMASSSRIQSIDTERNCTIFRDYNPFQLEHRALYFQFLNLRSAILASYIFDPLHTVKSTFIDPGTSKEPPWTSGLLKENLKGNPFLRMRFGQKMTQYIRNNYKSPPSKFIADVLRSICQHVRDEQTSRLNFNPDQQGYTLPEGQTIWKIPATDDLLVRTLLAIVLLRWGLLNEPQMNPKFGQANEPQYIMARNNLNASITPWWMTGESGFSKIVPQNGPDDFESLSIEQQLRRMSLHTTPVENSDQSPDPTLVTQLFESQAYDKEGFIQDWLNILDIDAQKISKLSIRQPLLD